MQTSNVHKVEKKSKTLKYVTIDGKTTLVKNDQTVNPLFVNPLGSMVKSMEPQKLYQTYTSVLVLCIREDVEFNIDILKSIFDYVVDNTRMDEVFKYLTLFRADVSMVRVNKHKNYANILEGSFLKKHFPHEEFEVTEIVIPLLEMKEKKARLYASLYHKSHSITDTKSVLKMTNHYNAGYKKPVYDQVISYLTEIGSAFWSNPDNCNINMTEMFSCRGFDYKAIRDDSTKAAVLANVKGDAEKVKERVINVMAQDGKEIDYIAAALETNAKFVDIYDALGSSGKRTYYAKTDEKGLELNKESIVELYKTTSDEFERFHLVSTLLTSKDYCHLVINNSAMLDLIKPLFDKYKVFFKYSFAYAWLCMYIEECIFKTKSTTKSRFVFDIETANKLPVFFTCIEDIWQNPYLTLLVDKAVADVPNNCISLYGIADEKYYGVCNMEEFQRRFNLFTSGVSTSNIFKGLDWKKFAVSGSIMSACLKKESPLIDNVSNPETDEDDKMLMYFRHYYGSSDVDVMCKTKSIFEFIESAGQVYETIVSNIPDYKEGDVSVEPVKSTAVIITQHFFKELLDDLNDELGTSFTSEELVKKIETKDEDVVEYFYDIYQSVKKKINKEIRKNTKELKKQYKFNKDILRLYTRKTLQGDINIKFRDHDVVKSEYQPSDSETCLFVNDFRDKSSQVSDDENYLVYKVGDGIRYKFKSPKLMRCIELFQVRGFDFFSVVGRFHLPCVRAYYQGDNVYILPSNITAMMTGINIEYKYFAGTNDPIKISNKYRTRGEGTIFNKRELKHMAFYNSEVDEDNGMYAIKGKSKNELQRHFTPREVSDNIYKPLKFKSGLPDETYLNPKYNYIKTMDDLRTAYQMHYGYDGKKSPIDMFKFKAINDKGSINPLRKWLIQGFWELHGSK